MCDSNDDNLPKTQIELAAHIGLETDRSVRDICTRLGLDSKTISQRDFRLAYIKDQRETAAGRGGDQQVTLAKARTEESTVKTAKMRLEFLRELGVVISAEDAADVITAWCRQANQDYTQGVTKLVSEIQSRYDITVDNEMVEDIVCPTTDRIKSHAEKLSRSLVESIEHIPEAEGTINN